MEFIIKLPIELDADESLVINRRKILEEWNLSTSCVTLWEVHYLEKFENKVDVQKDIMNIFSNLIRLSHSLYVSMMTEKDTYLALAYYRDEYDAMNKGWEKFKSEMQEIVDTEILIEECSNYVPKVPFYNPIIMIKALLQLKEIFKKEMDVNENNRLNNFSKRTLDHCVFLIKQCYNVIMSALNTICNSEYGNCVYNTVMDYDYKIVTSYFDEIIKDFESPDGVPQISLRNLGVGFHPEHGRGFFSTENIEPDTNIIEISASCALNFYTALFSDDFGYVARYLTNPTHYLNKMRSFNTSISNNNHTFATNNNGEVMFQPIDSDSILLLFVIFQVYKGRDSKWHKVISTWQDPTHAENQNLYMAPKEVTEFLSSGGNDFLSRVTNNIDECYDLLEHVHYLFDFIQHEAMRLSGNLNKDGEKDLYRCITFFRDLDYKSIFTWKSVNKVKYVLDTRSFSIKFWPLNERYYRYSVLDHSGCEGLIRQTVEGEDNVQLISMSVLDFSPVHSSKTVDLLLPVPTGCVRAILPVADMFNHSHLAPCSTPILDYERNMLVIKNEVEIEKNREVFIRYGILTSGECLYGYGFVPITKPVPGLFDTLTLNFEPEEDDPLYKVKILVLKHSNIPTDHIFSKLSPKKLTNLDLLIKCIQVVTSNDPISTIESWNNTLDNSKESKQCSNRTCCLEIVSEILESLLNPCIDNYNKLLSYRSSQDDTCSRPYWFDDWGERAIQYYSNQIDLINHSLEAITKDRKRQVDG